MPAGLTEKASARAEQAEADVRLALSEGNGHGALYEAIQHLRSETAKVRRRDPARAALIDAELAGVVLRIADQVHAHKPIRPAGCPRSPRPADLLDTFARALAETSPEGDPR